jgi:hypothetical protein
VSADCSVRDRSARDGGAAHPIAQKKIVACNKELNLPEASGID